MCAFHGTITHRRCSQVCARSREVVPQSLVVFSELPQSPYPIHLSSGSCINCSYCLQNPVFLSLFLATEILPLTIFYIIIMGLHVNLLTSPMMGYIIFCQSYINYIHIHPHIYLELYIISIMEGCGIMESVCTFSFGWHLEFELFLNFYTSYLLQLQFS